MNRKLFLRHTMLTVAGAAFLPAAAAPHLTADEPLPPDKVKEFVMAGHGNLEKVKSLLAELPNLLFASWDWKNGDFETALEGAGHVGNKDIARYLIEKGARPNLFVLAMLGHTALVKAQLEAYPPLLHAKGPHGLTLLHHAQKGGDEAKELADYLQAKGLTQTKAAM